MKRSNLLSLTSACFAGLVALGGCGGNDDPNSSDETSSMDGPTDSNTDEGNCQVGTQGCPCTLDGICEEGLTCIEGVCTDAAGTCGDGVLDAGEECDQGPNNSNEGVCKEDCTLQVCGDGYVGPGETCDDGNTVNDDECSNDCVLASCGDGIVQEGEECDDANTDEQDGCTSLCLEPFCGDGFVHDDEDCDDGNADETDGCSSSCAFAPLCGDGNRAQNEACFEPEKLLPVPGITDVAVADLDGDGHQDTAASMGALAGVQIFPGLGGGDFGEPTSVVSFEAGVQTGTSVGSIAIGDFNGDGFLDIAAALTSAENGGEAVYQEGTGNIADYASLAHRYKVSLPMGAGFLDVWDNPAGPDTLFNSANSATCLPFSSYNYEPGTSNPSEYYYSQRMDECGEGRAVLFGDFNGDADYDDSAVGLIHGQFSWQAPVADWTQPMGGSLPSQTVDAHQQGFLGWFNTDFMTDGVVADINGDGLDDLIVSHWSPTDCPYGMDPNVCEGDTIGWILGASDEETTNDDFFLEGDGDYGTVMGGRAPVAIIADDLDGDGDPDFATANFFDSEVSVFFNEGEGVLTRYADAPQLVDIVSVEIASADLNDDGAPDLVLAQAYTESVSILLSNP